MKRVGIKIVAALIEMIGLGLLFIGIAWIAPHVIATFNSVATCPIHVTTSQDDYCVSVGIGQ